jgi:hypothetical protein
MLGDIDTSALVNFETPPDILQHCTQSLTRELKRFPIPSTLDVNGLGTSRPFANLEIICDVYSNISGNTAGLALFKAHETISKIFGRGLPASWIHSLSHGVGVPILEALRICQNHPGKSWSPELYKFVGRPDYAAKTARPTDDELSCVDVSDCVMPGYDEPLISDSRGPTDHWRSHEYLCHYY